MFSLKKVFVLGYIFASLSTVSFAYTQQNGTITGNNVNIRKEASKKSIVLFQLPRNKSVKVLDNKSGWYKISYNNKTGWISDDFIKISKVAQNPNAKEVITKLDNKSQDTRKVTANNVNIRAKASTSSSVITKAKINQKVTILAIEKEWSKISINGKTGWINNKFLEKIAADTKVVSNATNMQPISGVIKGNRINVRKSPSTTAPVITKVSNGNPVKILATSNGWTKISTVSSTGWVLSKYVSNSLKTVSRSGSTLRDARNLEYDGNLASQIIATGKEFLGTNYVYGGTTPRGFDCSGFIGYIMRENGIDLPRTSGEQANVGEYVSRNDLRPGDLVFFDTDGGKNHISHVGMYIGNGDFIHASSGGYGEVRISSLSEHFYNVTYVTARRVIK